MFASLSTNLSFGFFKERSHPTTLVPTVIISTEYTAISRLAIMSNFNGLKINI